MIIPENYALILGTSIPPQVVCVVSGGNVDLTLLNSYFGPWPQLQRICHISSFELLLAHSHAPSIAKLVVCCVPHSVVQTSSPLPALLPRASAAAAVEQARRCSRPPTNSLERRARSSNFIFGCGISNCKDISYLTLHHVQSPFFRILAQQQFCGF